MVNITSREWECVDETTNVCPGSVEFFCPDDSIPTGKLETTSNDNIKETYILYDFQRWSKWNVAVMIGRFT